MGGFVSLVGWVLIIPGILVVTAGGLIAIGMAVGPRELGTGLIAGLVVIAGGLALCGPGAILLALGQVCQDLLRLCECTERMERTRRDERTGEWCSREERPKMSGYRGADGRWVDTTTDGEIQEAETQKAAAREATRRRKG